MKSKNWNDTKHLLIFTIIICILFLIICYLCSNDKYQENFEQKNNWVDSIKCLNLNNNEINLFHSYLSNMLTGEEPKKDLTDIIKMLINKGLDYDNIMNCLFQPNNKINETFT